MSEEDFSQGVKLICPTCKGADFDYEEGSRNAITQIKCTNCKIVMTYDELLEGNDEIILNHAEKLKSQI